MSSDKLASAAYPSVGVEAPEGMPRRILVVDDEAMVGDAVRRILEMDRHTVETATSAQGALAAFQAGKFDLIIIDYELPLMKGDKLAAAIKTLQPNQPILMITAYGESLRAAGEYPLAVDQVVNKPFDTNEFRAAVRQVATQRQPPGFRPKAGGQAESRQPQSTDRSLLPNP